jgi:hypothetical protein
MVITSRGRQPGTASASIELVGLERRSFILARHLYAGRPGAEIFPFLLTPGSRYHGHQRAGGAHGLSDSTLHMPNPSWPTATRAMITLDARTFRSSHDETRRPRGPGQTITVILRNRRRPDQASKTLKSYRPRHGMVLSMTRHAGRRIHRQGRQDDLRGLRTHLKTAPYVRGPLAARDAADDPQSPSFSDPADISACPQS